MDAPRYPKKARRPVKKLVIGFCVLLTVGIVSAVLIIFWHSHSKKGAPTNTPQTQSVTTPTAPQQVPLSQKYSTTDPTSIWIIANKTHPLPSGYAPSDLSRPDIAVNDSKTNGETMVRTVIQKDLKAMFTAATADGINLYMSSGYRSESVQAGYYNAYVARDGVEAANRYSAKPGTSEHQTGLALDISAVKDVCHLEQCFADTPEGKWLAANAYKYGFVLRYPKGKEAETGYEFEPWHYRYVGVDLATEVTSKNETLEAYFGLL